MPQCKQEYVTLASATAGRNPGGSYPCQGVYYSPNKGKPRTAFIATHYNGDNSGQYLADFLAERGYGFLGWNSRYRGAEAYFLLEHALIDIHAGVRWLKEVAKVDNVVLYGNSGGGSLMGAYQSQARGVTISPAPDNELPDALHELTPGDAYVSLNAHRGRPEVLTSWLDPSVTDEFDPTAVDPELDMYNADNGPPYSSEFIERYRAAQVGRNQRITDWCLSEIARLKSHGMHERAFILSRTWADLRFLDGTIDPSARELNRCYGGIPKVANYGPRGIGVMCTLRNWLSMWSLQYSHCIGAPHLNRITVPSLVVQGTADTGIFPSDARSILEDLASEDKQLEMIPGDHMMTTPDDARDHAADLIAGWLAARDM